MKGQESVISEKTIALFMNCKPMGSLKLPSLIGVSLVTEGGGALFT